MNLRQRASTPSLLLVFTSSLAGSVRSDILVAVDLAAGRVQWRTLIQVGAGSGQAIAGFDLATGGRAIARIDCSRVSSRPRSRASGATRAIG